MRMKFTITIDTDEANANELEEAIRDALQVLNMPNGDTLYTASFHVNLDYKDE